MKYIFLRANHCILNWISLNFLEVHFYINLTLARGMTWRRKSDNPFANPLLTFDTRWRSYVAMNTIASSQPCSTLPLKARFLGPTWGPSGADRTQVGPMLAPGTLLFRTFMCSLESWPSVNTVGIKGKICHCSFINTTWSVSDCLDHQCRADDLGNIDKWFRFQKSPVEALWCRRRCQSGTWLLFHWLTLHAAVFS